jgi:uncharacterized protein YbcI
LKVEKIELQNILSNAEKLIIKQRQDLSQIETVMEELVSQENNFRNDYCQI